MRLYPIITLDLDIAAQGQNTIPSGMLVVVPLSMFSVRMTQITIKQISATQDYSMRSWVSRYPDGMALPPGVFAVMRFNCPFVLYQAGQAPPIDYPAVRVSASSYVINILNLTNEPNIFTFSKIDLA